MICQAWRSAADAEVASLLAAEVRAWRHDLDWDVTEAWKVVDPARRAGQLPGFIVRDDEGRAAGWTAFLLHRDSLQVLAFVADGADAAAALLNAIAASPEAGAARSTIVCVREGAPRFAGMLLRRGFDVEPYRYLRLTLVPGPPETDGLRPWQDDGDAMTRVCARAYAGSGGVRAFAPGGTLEEWQDYLATLLHGPGCGRFLPEISFVHPARGTPGLDGGVIVTDLGPGTAHVAQIAVAPDRQGRGLGRRLLTASARAASALGYTYITLLVSASNGPAVAMYDALGFVDRATFVVATRRQPILSMRPALATGGESTRR